MNILLGKVLQPGSCKETFIDAIKMHKAFNQYMFGSMKISSRNTQGCETPRQAAGQDQRGFGPCQQVGQELPMQSVCFKRTR